LISAFFLQENHDYIYATTCSLSQFDEKNIMWKFQCLENLRQTLKIFWLLFSFIRFKVLNFRFRRHVHEMIMQKNMLIFKAHVFMFLLVNQNVHAQLCTHKKSPPSHELSYFGLLKFSYLNLSHVNVVCKN
jgi:hypothetical protein